MECLKNNLFSDTTESTNTFDNELEINKINSTSIILELLTLLIYNLGKLISTQSVDYIENQIEIDCLLKKTITLLKELENNPNNKTEFYVLKNENNEIKKEKNIDSCQIDNMESTTLLPENQVDNFLKDPLTIKYLNLFNLDLTKQNNAVNSFDNYDLLYSKILNNFEYKSLKDQTLLVSEKNNKVYLPYTKSELNEYLIQYPNKYFSEDDVISSEFILPLSYYQNHPSLARFREAYSLIRDKEMKSIIEALKFSFNLMFKYELNPGIIAACKTQGQLENYIDCLDKNKLDEFDDFKIKFEVNPI